MGARYTYTYKETFESSHVKFYFCNGREFQIQDYISLQLLSREAFPWLIIKVLQREFLPFHPYRLQTLCIHSF